MTAMPQQIAISHGFGAAAATLVGIDEFVVRGFGAGIDHGTMIALGLETLLGALTITGSVMAFGKLQELIPGRPITWPGQNVDEHRAVRRRGGTAAGGWWCSPASPMVVLDR